MAAVANWLKNIHLNPLFFVEIDSATYYTSILCKYLINISIILNIMEQEMQFLLKWSKFGDHFDFQYGRRCQGNLLSNVELNLPFVLNVPLKFFLRYVH
jgi:hypothetical protein